MSIYVCTVCNWEYNESEGYEEGAVKPNTKFEDLPDDFECPMCFAGKDMFEKKL